MSIAKISVTRPVLTTVIILTFIIFGGISYFSLNLNLEPDIDIPYVTIVTVYPGAGPKEIEMSISKKIEDAVASISQIERIESFSLDGLSLVVIQFKIGKKVDVANQEAKDKVDEIINNLPEDAKKPIIQKVDFKAIPIADVILTGNLSQRELFEIADKNLKDRFSQIPGVAKVNITGGQEREIRIEFDNKVVYENNISLPQLLQILKAQNMDIPGGYFQLKDQEYTVRLEGKFQNTNSLKDIQIPSGEGLKKLGQIAQIKDLGKDIRQRSTYFNNIKKEKNSNVIRLGIVKSADGNIVKVVDALKEGLPEIRKILPAGTSLEMVDNSADFVRSSVDDTMSNIYLGIIFTSLILLLFLHDIRSTIIVALSMPGSIISTFLLLKYFNLTLNMMTLMGLSVSIGVLVANSVVVIENIFRFKHLGFNSKDAAIKGTEEVTVAVLASTLTNLVVFLPLANMSSIVGQYLKELALAATFATIFSLILSFTLTPMLAALILPDKPKKNKLGEKIEKMLIAWDNWYKNTLIFILRNKKTSIFTLLSTVLIFILIVGYYMPKLGFEFIPFMDDGKIKVEVELTEGYNLEATSKILEQIEEKLKKHPEVKHIIANLGKLSETDIGTNMARMDIQLIDKSERNLGLHQMIGLFTKELANISNAKIKVDISSSMGEGGAPVNFFLYGQDVQKLEMYKDSVIKRVKDIPGLINFDNSSRAGKPEITVYPIREKLAETGLTVMDIALTLRASIEGIVSSKYKEFGNEYDITVTMTDESVNTPDKIGNIAIISPLVGAIKLSQIADVKFTKGYTKILHRDKYISIQFNGTNAANVPLGNITSEVEKRLADMNFQSGYGFSWGGNIKMMYEMIADMLFAFMIAIILTYLLIAAMLESFIQPIPIMLTVPLALIGIVVFMYYTDTAFGITSLMAVVMLIGIVVNNAILMLDFTNQLMREQNYSAKDALIEACPTKLRPVIMSSLALILGMLPMALGIGDTGVEMRTPMGIVSIAGLIVSALLTLWVIPAFYFVTSKSKLKVSN